LQARLATLKAATEKDLVECWNRKEEIIQIDKNLELLAANTEKIKADAAIRQEEAELMKQKARAAAEQHEQQLKAKQAQLLADDQRYLEEYERKLEACQDDDAREELTMEFSVGKAEREFLRQKCRLDQGRARKERIAKEEAQ